MLRALGSTGIGSCIWRSHKAQHCSESCEITHETGGTFCCGHWALRLVISHTRQGSAHGDTTHEIGGTFCYGHWILYLVLSPTKQEVQFATGFGFCILCFYPRNKVCDFLPALGSASCDITHKTGDTNCFELCRNSGGTICYGHWVLHLVISHTIQGYDLSHTKQRGHDLLQALDLYLVLSHTRHGVRFVSGIVFCILRYHSRDGDTTGWEHSVLRLVISHTRPGCDLLRELGSASCDILNTLPVTNRTPVSCVRSQDKEPKARKQNPMALPLPLGAAPAPCPPCPAPAPALSASAPAPCPCLLSLPLRPPGPLPLPLLLPPASPPLPLPSPKL